MIKSQKRIDDFFTSHTTKNDNYIIKKYFYLNIDDKFKPTKQAYWTDKRPEKINFIEIINCDYIKKNHYYYICGYFTDFNEKEYKFTKEKVYKNVEYLTSHLQKSIRKGNEMLAIPTCYHLFKLDLIRLLKLLPMIMLEDVFLHESFPTLIWYIIANSTKKFKMMIYHYEWILGLIYILCKINVKDDINNLDNINEDNNLLVIEKLNNYSSNIYSEEESSFLYSINILMSMVSNKCDLKMLVHYENIWKKRFIEKNTLLNKTDIMPICIYVKELTLNDWDLSAIDYYCHPKLLDFIIKKYNHLSVDELKMIIWHHSTYINYRTKHVSHDIKNWNMIKGFVERTQKYLLDSYH